MFSYRLEPNGRIMTHPFGGTINSLDLKMDRLIIKIMKSPCALHILTKNMIQKYILGFAIKILIPFELEK